MADLVFIRRSFSTELVSYREYRLRSFLCVALVAVAVLLVTISIVYVFLNYSSTYPGEIELSNGDTRALDVSSLFCEGVSIAKASSSSKLYILPKLEILSGFDKRNFSSRIFIRKTKYWLRSHYLLEGSVVQIEVRSDYNVKLEIVQSRGEFNDWIEKFDSGEGLQRSESSTELSRTFPVPESDNYYFILTSHAAKSDYVGISITFILKRKLFDLSNPLYVCNFGLKQTCSEKLDFASSSSAVLLLDARSTSPNISYIQWECIPRIWFYAALFGGVFIISTAFFITGYVCLNRHMKRKVQLGTDPDILTNNSLRRQRSMEDNAIRSMTPEEIPLTMIIGDLPSEPQETDGQEQPVEDESTEGEPPETPVEEGVGQIRRQLTIPYKQPPPYDNRASAIEYEGELQMNSSAKSAVRRNPSFLTFTQNDVSGAVQEPRVNPGEPRERGDGTEDDINYRNTSESHPQDPVPEDYRFSLVTDL